MGAGQGDFMTAAGLFCLRGGLLDFREMIRVLVIGGVLGGDALILLRTGGGWIEMGWKAPGRFRVEDDPCRDGKPRK